MTRRLRDPRARWQSGARALAAVILVGGARAAAAQSKTVYTPPKPAIIQTTNSVTIAGTFAVTPGPLTQTSLTGSLCSPGACYSGTTTARGNRGWQLQVKLATDPGTFTVAFVEATVPPGAQAVNTGTQQPLSTGIWLTIAHAASATASAPVGVMFNANKTNGKNGVVPTAAQLAAVLTYQVVAY